MQWLGLPKQKGSYVIAYCGGSFDFQMILKYFLSDEVLRMTKVKAPLLRGNKIVTPVINNDRKLIDSYTFVAHALAKFPSIFEIPEEKKGFPLTRSIDQNFGVMLDSHIGSILSLICFTQLNVMSFSVGMMIK